MQYEKKEKPVEILESTVTFWVEIDNKTIATTKVNPGWVAIIQGEKAIAVMSKEDFLLQYKVKEPSMDELIKRAAAKIASPYSLNPLGAYVEGPIMPLQPHRVQYQGMYWDDK